MTGALLATLQWGERYMYLGTRLLFRTVRIQMPKRTGTEEGQTILLAIEPLTMGIKVPTQK